MAYGEELESVRIRQSIMDVDTEMNIERKLLRASH